MRHATSNQTTLSRTIRRLAAASIAAGAAAIALPAASLAQARVPQDATNAPIPSNGQLKEKEATQPIGRGDVSTLPGVDLSGPQPDDEVEGPGGLENGVGAVGLAAPQQSGSNPIPIETPQSEETGIPLTTPTTE